METVGVVKMYKRHKERGRRLEKYDPSMCILHGTQLKDLSSKVDELTVSSKLLVGGMFELMTKEKFGKVNGTFEELYQKMVDHLTAK